MINPATQPALFRESVAEIQHSLRMGGFTSWSRGSGSTTAILELAKHWHPNCLIVVPTERDKYHSEILFHFLFGADVDLPRMIVCSHKAHMMRFRGMSPMPKVLVDGLDRMPLETRGFLQELFDFVSGVL